MGEGSPQDGGMDKDRRIEKGEYVTGRRKCSKHKKWLKLLSEEMHYISVLEVTYAFFALVISKCCLHNYTDCSRVVQA